jgi:phosphoserine phosphatase
MKPKLIVFDLNKTLIHENSWRDLNAALGVTEAEDKQLLSWAEEGIIDDHTGQAILCSIYKTRATPTRKTIMAVVGNYTYLSGAQETVAELHKRGYEIALISGAMDILVKEIADELHIRHWRAANKFVFNDSDVLERIDSVKNDAAHKAEMLVELCEELGCEPNECVAVGDGDNDIELFKVTGSCITFKGSKIEHEAKHVISTLDEILSIVI